mmetsp:Transcript_6587/g.20014  ORF Transcript_6587/g.20014 Transcript_6587/m.20014 type:complete len:246 (+) Transcript_6587:326-1063(+)
MVREGVSLPECRECNLRRPPDRPHGQVIAGLPRDNHLPHHRHYLPGPLLTGGCAAARRAQAALLLHDGVALERLRPHAGGRPRDRGACHPVHGSGPGPLVHVPAAGRAGSPDHQALPRHGARRRVSDAPHVYRALLQVLPLGGGTPPAHELRHGHLPGADHLQLKAVRGHLRLRLGLLDSVVRLRGRRGVLALHGFDRRCRLGRHCGPDQGPHLPLGGLPLHCIHAIRHPGPDERGDRYVRPECY